MTTKYIFVTGGVVSGLGKGITTAALGCLLKARGLKITAMKFDPYINIDPGVMSPSQHGEVFVTDDGAETDLDVGHYERFTNMNLTSNSNISVGKVYWEVLSKEREGLFGGDTVQVIPHITDVIKEKIMHEKQDQRSDIIICEVGGTVGDIESLPVLEAIRQMAVEAGRDNVLYIHVTLIPYLSKAGELKSKATQHSVKELLSIGIQPDIIVCRTEQNIPKDMKDKIALFCNLNKDCVIQNIDCDSTYDVPLLFEDQNLSALVCDKLKIPCGELNLTDWINLTERMKYITGGVEIAVVGKYVEHDAYLSVAEALRSAGIAHGVNVRINWVNSEDLENDVPAEKLFKNSKGIIAPAGFGERGTRGIINAIHYAREARIPFFGLCLGFQCAVIEYARNAANLDDADTTEYTPETKTPLVHLIPELRAAKALGGTMRRGARPCKLAKDTIVHDAYKEELIYERFRHRYEFNNYYRDELASKGLVFSGYSADERSAVVVELPRDKHPWFVATQYHAEFKSRPNKPHPLFLNFIEAVLKNM
jgi:CTP synthase